MKGDQLSEGELISQQVRAVSSLSRIMMAANVVNTIALLLIFYGTNTLGWQQILWAIAAVFFAIVLLRRSNKHRGRVFPRTMPKKIRTKVVIYAGVLGLLWSIPGLVFLPVAPEIVQAFLIMLAAGMVSGSAIALYPVPAAALLCCSLIAIGHLIGFAFVGGMLFFPFLFLALMFCGVIFLSIVRHEKIFVAEFRARRALDLKNASITQLLEETREEARRQQLEAVEKIFQARKIEAVGRLTAGIAHDFNNLLSVVMGNLQLIRLTENKDEINEFLTEADTAAERGADLTRRLLTFGRNAPLAPEVVDINDVIERILPLLKRTLTASIQVDLDLTARACPIEIDILEFERALLNLAINARDAMEGKGLLTIGTRNLNGENQKIGHVAAFTPQVHIFVKDTGYGISQETLEHMFEPFFTTKPEGKGTGLGLSMVHGFVQQSNGSIEIASEEGLGTTVSLIFPKQDAQNDTPTKAASSGRELKLQGRRVLLVEDEPDQRRMLAFQLSKLGCAVAEASNGDEALAFLHADTKVDLMITDFNMPGTLNGVQLLNIASELRPNLKMILVSGGAERARKSLGTLQDKVDFLGKPIALAELEKTITHQFGIQSKDSAGIG